MLGIGIIGCGNISTAYLRLAPLFKGLEVRAVADLNLDTARAQASALMCARTAWKNCWPQTTSTSW